MITPEGSRRSRPNATAGGRGHLSARQAVRIRDLMLGKMPDQLKLPFYLWTRAAVAELIAREYGLRVSLTNVGLICRQGQESPQKPMRHAYECNDAAITRWLARSIQRARQAKHDKAVIYWGDEMRLRSDHVTGTSYAPAGQTPVVQDTGQRFGCNMISAITNKGALPFMVLTGKFQAPVFVEFMRRLLKQVKGKVYLIVDGHPAHRSRQIKAFVDEHANRLRLIRLPGYCPELNPDELLNQDVKTNGLGNNRPRDKAEMMAAVRSHLYRRQKQPQIIRNLFLEKTCSLCRLTNYALFNGLLSKCLMQPFAIVEYFDPFKDCTFSLSAGLEVALPD